VFEYFEGKQKGSSAMPHKKNPISSENVSGIARVLRGYALTSLENNNYSFQKLQITDMISQLNIEYQKLERETLFLENLLAILSSQNSNQEIKEEEKELTLEEIEND